MKTHTISPKVTTKITKLRIIVNKPTKNKVIKIFSAKEDRKRGKRSSIDGTDEKQMARRCI